MLAGWLAGGWSGKANERDERRACESAGTKGERTNERLHKKWTERLKCVHVESLGDAESAERL